jgi:hypothetical protein
VDLHASDQGRRLLHAAFQDLRAEMVAHRRDIAALVAGGSSADPEHVAAFQRLHAEGDVILDRLRLLLDELYLPGQKPPSP